MDARILHDGNFVRVRREFVGLSDTHTVVTITSTQKTHASSDRNAWPPDLILSEDEWKDVQRAAEQDE